MTKSNLIFIFLSLTGSLDLYSQTGREQFLVIGTYTVGTKMRTARGSPSPVMLLLFHLTKQQANSIS